VIAALTKIILAKLAGLPPAKCYAENKSRENEKF
jgi:hypothetical protein